MINTTSKFTIEKLSLISFLLLSRGTYHFDEVLSKADDVAIKKVRKDFPLIQTDDGFNIQFTSVNNLKHKDF